MFQRRVTVYPSPGADWKTLINMQIFDGFRPGMTSIEAKMKHGEPDEIGSNSLGPYYTYKRAGGEVFVAWEEHRSGVDGFKVWTLRAYPKPGDPKRFLHSSVLKYLDPGAEQVELTIMNGDPVAHVDFGRWENQVYYLD